MTTQIEEPAKATDEGASYKMGPIGKTVLLLAVVMPLAGMVWAIVLLWNSWVDWQDIAVLGTFYALTVIGVGVGFHRMLTHKSFDAPPFVRFFFLALGSMSMQGPAISWAATHHKHHAKSDKEGDPHSPLHGFWQAHVLWLFKDRLVGGGVWARPYENDKVAKFIDKTFFAWSVLGFVLPGLLSISIGGGFWNGLLWGGLVRIFLVQHVTWSVNSVCHTFGRRAYRSNDESRNEWVIGLIGAGEGWHNNHHAFPKAAYHGMRWWQFDLNGYVIRILKWTRLAKNVWMPKREDREARKLPKV